MHRFRIALLAALAASVAPMACTSPRTQANIAQALNDAGMQINSMQQDVAVLQEQVDSLREVVARQDTLLSRLAALANVPISR